MDKDNERIVNRSVTVPRFRSAGFDGVGDVGRPLLVLEWPRSMELPLRLVVRDLESAELIDDLDVCTLMGFPPLTIVETKVRKWALSPLRTLVHTTVWSSTCLTVAFRPSISKLCIQTFRWIEMGNGNGLKRVSPVDRWIDLNSIILTHYDRYPLSAQHESYEPKSTRFRLTKIITVKAGRLIIVRLRDMSSTPPPTTQPPSDWYLEHSIDILVDLENDRTDYLGDLGPHSFTAVCETY